MYWWKLSYLILYFCSPFTLEVRELFGMCIFFALPIQKYSKTNTRLLRTTGDTVRKTGVNIDVRGKQLNRRPKQRRLDKYIAWGIPERSLYPPRAFDCEKCRCPPYQKRGPRFEAGQEEEEEGEWEEATHLLGPISVADEWSLFSRMNETYKTSLPGKLFTLIPEDTHKYVSLIWNSRTRGVFYATDLWHYKSLSALLCYHSMNSPTGMQSKLSWKLPALADFTQTSWHIALLPVWNSWWDERGACSLNGSSTESRCFFCDNMSTSVVFLIRCKSLGNHGNIALVLSKLSFLQSIFRIIERPAFFHKGVRILYSLTKKEGTAIEKRRWVVLVLKLTIQTFSRNNLLLSR